MRFKGFRSGAMRFGLAVMVSVCPLARAAEHVTLKNGFELDCVRQQVVGDKVRLYLAGTNAAAAEGSNYLEVAADSVVRVETVADPPPTVDSAGGVGGASTELPTKLEMREMLAQAGVAHHIDEDLLASVVRAESAGQVRAVSRTGAQGLMQLMPGTASAMGVEDAFKADQNIAGDGVSGCAADAVPRQCGFRAGCL